MAASTYLNQVQQLYIAYFGRPADPAGQLYWAQIIDAAGGNITSMLAGFAGSSESQALYGNSTTIQKVTAIYTNLFNRTPEPAGLAYWVRLIDSNQVSPAQAAWAIQQAAGPGDALAVSNKLTAANLFTASLDTPAEIAGYSGTNAAAVARTFLNKVDSTAASIANLASYTITDVATATGTTVTPAPTPDPTPTPTPTPVFSATKSVGNVVTFSNVGSTISATLSGTEFTFASNGTSAGTITVAGPFTSITVPAATTLTISTEAAGNITFPGAGTVLLTDVGLVNASVLKTIETATTGLLDASRVSTLNAASIADAKLLLSDNNGSSGDKIKTAANIGVNLTGSFANGGDLKAIDLATTGLVDATSVGTLSASLADAQLLLVTDKGSTGDKIQTRADIAVFLNDVTATGAALNAIDLATTGLVTAPSLTGITGSMADVKIALEAITTGTALSATSLNSVTLSTAINTHSLDNVVFANNTTLTLANVAGNAIEFVDSTVGAGKHLTINGSALTNSAMSFYALTETNGTFTVIGGAGNDFFVGGQKADTLTGGAGNDTFAYNSTNKSTLSTMDTITDYRAIGSGNDTLSFTVAPVLGTTTTVQASTAVDLAAALDDMANSNTVSNGLSVFTWSNDTYVYIEQTGAGSTYVATDIVIKLSGTPFAVSDNVIGLGLGTNPHA